jgi:hypothetical protein
VFTCSDENISPVFFVAVCIKKMEQYIVGEWIGGGSFGAVHKITRKSDNQVTLLIYYQALKFPLILLKKQLQKQSLVWKAVHYGCMNEAQKKMIVSEVLHTHTNMITT